MSLRALLGFCRVAVSTCVVLCVACEEPPPPTQAKPEPEGGEEQEKSAEIAPKIASAMQAAAEQSARAEGAGAANAPPPNGILDPGQAQAEVPAGDPPRLVLGSNGTPPRVDLSSAPVGSAKAQLELQVRLGGSVMPTVQLELEQAATQAASAGPDGRAAEAGRRFDVVEAKLASEQPGRLPPGAEKTIGRLRGAQLIFPSGTGGLQPGSVVLETAKDDLRPLAVGALDAMSSLTMPVPSEPVGAGAYWMVKSRETYNEAQVLAYRMFRVTQVSGNQVELSLNIKRYLTEARLPLVGLPPHRVQEWRSEGKGTITLDQTERLSRSLELQDSFLAIVVPEEGASQAIPVQGETQVKMSRVTP